MMVDDRNREGVFDSAGPRGDTWETVSHVAEWEAAGTESALISEEDIERVARVISPRDWKLYDESPLSPHEPSAQSLVSKSLRIARSLADNGLLAPGELSEEWRVFDKRGSGEAPARGRGQAERIAVELNGEGEEFEYSGEWVVQSRMVSRWEDRG